jgi:hypothetical protein
MQRIIKGSNRASINTAKKMQRIIKARKVISSKKAVERVPNPASTYLNPTCSGV